MHITNPPLFSNYRELWMTERKEHGNKIGARGRGRGSTTHRCFYPFEVGIPPFKEENN